MAFFDTAEAAENHLTFLREQVWTSAAVARGIGRRAARHGPARGGHRLLRLDCRPGVEGDLASGGEPVRSSLTRR